MTTTPSADVDRVGPAFIDVAHRVVWATVATVDLAGHPRTRVLHPIWEYADGRLTGWVATSPASPKAHHLQATPHLSITYWDQLQDVATVDGRAVWETTPTERRAAWERFASAPEPVGYDPSIIPEWTSPDAEAFGVVRIEPTRVRVFPGTLLLHGDGELLTWST